MARSGVPAYIGGMDSDHDTEHDRPGLIRAEYVLVLVLVFLAGLAFPAFLEVNKVTSIALSICAGLGLL